MAVPNTPPAGMTARSLYSMLRRLVGAEIIGVADEAGYFTGDTVEEVLAELGAGIGLTDVKAAPPTAELTIAAGVITATNTYHTIDTEGDAGTDDLDTINGLTDGQFYVFKIAAAARNVVFKHGTGNIINPSGRDITLDVLNDKVFGFSDGTSLFVLDMSLATPTGGGLASALAAVTASQGASLIGIQDVATIYAAATVEAALAEVKVLADAALASSNNHFVIATIAVANATGGATNAALTVALTSLSGAALTSARQILIMGSPTAYQPAPPLGVSLTFGTPTVGSIVASGGGWCLALTDATGAFACTATNSADETRQFSVTSPQNGVSSTAQACVVVGSNVDPATWSA